MALAAHFQLATRRGDATARMATARQLADARAGDPPTLLAAAKLLDGVGDHARAAVCYEVALDQAAQPDGALLGQIGIARLRAGNLDGAEAAFTAAASLRPSDARPVYYLGVIARKRGDLASARVRFTRALVLAPGMPKAARALAELDVPHP